MKRSKLVNITHSYNICKKLFQKKAKIEKLILM